MSYLCSTQEGQSSLYKTIRDLLGVLGSWAREGEIQKGKHSPGGSSLRYCQVVWPYTLAHKYPPMPMHIPFLTLTGHHCFLPFPSHFSLHTFLNHFPVLNSHKNVFIEYILGEGTGPSSTEDIMNSSYLLSTGGWGLDRDLNCIEHVSGGRGK